MVNVFPSFPTARGPYGASLRSAGPTLARIAGSGCPAIATPDSRPNC